MGIILLCGVGLVVHAFIILGLFNMFDDTPTSSTSVTSPTLASEKKEAEKKQTDDSKKETLALAGAMILKRNMRNPDRFKVESALVTPGETAVCYSYRAENGFGGLNYGRAVLDCKKETIKTNEMAGFSKAWNKNCANRKCTDLTEYVKMMVQ
jgi:hypothetical protein